jgi:hypothetical protein
MLFAARRASAEAPGASATTAPSAPPTANAYPPAQPAAPSNAYPPTQPAAPSSYPPPPSPPPYQGYPPATQPGAPWSYPPPGYQPAPPQPLPGAYGPPPGAPPSNPPPEPAPAWRASDPGVIIGAERLFGVYSEKVNVSNTGAPSSTSSITMVNLLWGNSSDDSGGDINPGAMPMLTIHGVVRGGLTLGGGIGYVSTSGSAQGGGGPDTDLATRHAFTIAPRVGYMMWLSPALSIWWRGGVSYADQKQTLPPVADCSSGTCVNGPTTTTEFSNVDLSLDPMLVITPVSHVGIFVGPAIDVGMSGKSSYDDGTNHLENDATDSSFGLAAGIGLLI